MLMLHLLMMLLLQLELQLALGVAGTAAGSAAPPTEYTHRGGGLTSAIMSSVISQLPPVAPSGSGVREGSELMRTVRLHGDYQADVPLLLPSYTRLVLNGSITAIPDTLRWTKGSGGPPQQSASLLTAKGATMVSIEGGSWSCAGWNSTVEGGNTTSVTAIFFDSTSFSFIRNLHITRCGMYSGGNDSASIGIRRTAYGTGNIRVEGGGSNVIADVDSSYSTCRGIWARTDKLVVSGGYYHHNNADGIDLDSAASHCTVHNTTCSMNGRHGVFLEEGASFNTVVGNTLIDNHMEGISTGANLGHEQTHNLLIANVLGPNNYPAGCPIQKRPCPSYCPVNATCSPLPCGWCHYIDQKTYETHSHGFTIGGSSWARRESGTIAILNDLGGSTAGAGDGRVEKVLVALNYNGTIDNSGVDDDAPNVNSSLFAFNPDAKAPKHCGDIEGSSANDYRHSGGGLTSVVMDSIITKLPPIKTNSSGVHGIELMRTVRLRGAYQADVPLILPSYTRLILNGSVEALPYKLSWTPGSAGEPNMTAALVSATNATMVSVEGGSWSCAKWNSSSDHGNTSDVTAVYFDQTSFSFMRNMNITTCGVYSGGPCTFNFTTKSYNSNCNQSTTIGIGRMAYVSGNIRVHGGQSNVIENVESSFSANRGVWAQTNKLIVTGGSYHHNNADGIDLDSSSSHCTIHNVSAYMNSRMGVFMEFTSGFNTIVDSNLGGNHYAGVTHGSSTWGSTYNVLIGNTFGGPMYPAGCPLSARPCPSYCPLPDRFPCHYTDYASYAGGQGFVVQGSVGAIAVLNDLGGRSSGAANGLVVDDLIALNFNGTIDTSGVDKSLKADNTSVFAWNPAAAT